MEDTLQAAKLARGDQGYHETEVSFGGECDLHRHLVDCDKNPGHSNFIPVTKFGLSDLPVQYQDLDIVRYVLAQAELTVRVTSKYTSLSRPDGYSFSHYKGGSFLRTGTGFVQYVYRNEARSNKPCPCPICRQTGNPRKEWAKVKVRTATHVVFDDLEAQNTVVELFYDDEKEKTTKVRKIYGDNVRFGATQGDWCDMRCVTHDLDLCDYLKDAWGKWRWLEMKVNEKYRLKRPRDDQNNVSKWDGNDADETEHSIGHTGAVLNLDCGVVPLHKRTIGSRVGSHIKGPVGCGTKHHDDDVEQLQSLSDKSKSDAISVSCGNTIDDDVCVGSSQTDIVCGKQKEDDHEPDTTEAFREHFESCRPDSGEESRPEESSTSDEEPRLAIIVSHPHGCNKQVSVGQWVERYVIDSSRGWENSVYTYDTPTCPGSSGAPVWLLGRMRWGGFFGRHPHSGRPIEGLNVSAVGWDRVV